jgi:hypothetical protein
MQIIMEGVGRISWFGGPNDTGVGADEGLALITAEQSVTAAYRGLFLPSLNPANGLARQLDPLKFYCAMRWNYDLHSPAVLAKGACQIVAASGATCWARPVDWGPNADTGRLIDVSPGALEFMGIQTDDIVTVNFVG